MKPSRLSFGVLSFLLVAGCAHMHRSAEPAPKAPEAAPKAAEAAEAAPPSAADALAAFKMPHMCLGRAMHASSALPADASPEQTKKIYWNGYFEAFLDAKEQQKYIDCLDEDRADKSYEAHHREATKWLKWAQDESEKYKAFFPPAKRIVDAAESFSDVSAKVGLRKVVLTLQDGTQVAEESRFDKLPQ